jgi:hypothetical protein
MRGAILLLLLAGTSPPGASAGAAGRDACRLLTPGEIATVAGGRVAETKPTSRTVGNLEISDCFFRTEKFQDSVSVEVTRGAKGSPQGAGERWSAVFHPEVEGAEEREPEEGAASTGKEKETPPRPVEGVGEEAFWIRNPASGALYVRKGDAYVRISVGGAADEDAKLRRATELARRALGRL